LSGSISSIYDSSVSTTVSAHDATTGPAAGAALASLSGLTPGRYAVDVYGYFSGTVTAAEADNIELLVDGTPADVVLVAPVANGPAVKQSFEHLTADGTIGLQAVGNAGASAVYHTVLVAALLPHYDAG
jgi:hypothetical protein